MDQDIEDLLVRIAQAVEKLAGINDNEDREWELAVRALGEKPNLVEEE
mgnify:FL=1|tara:strand:- start:10719 stop:10862 length:144 start_codon:yes stop_codon:yes gene_type:complete